MLLAEVNVLYSSELVTRALSLKPDPSLPVWHGEPTLCSHCAAPIVSGIPYSPLKARAFFSDTRDLAASNAVVCWRCVHLRSKVLLNGLSYTVVTSHGIYPIAKDTHKAWLLLTPPEPPFVAVHGSTTMQHLAWRTPVTLSKELIYLRFGPSLYRIQPAKLLQAINIAVSLSERQGKWTSPLFLDRKAEEPFHGQFNAAALPHLQDAEKKFFLELGAGERWALAYLMHSKLPSPEQPAPITQTILSKIK